MPRPVAPAPGVAPAPAAAERCAVHPSRFAVDRCPVCGRPRCAADAADAADAAGALAGGRTGCLACRGTVARAPRPAADAERLVAGLLGALATALLAGAVWSQYVGTPYMAYLVPFGLGVAVAFVAFRAARTEAASQARTALAAQVRRGAVGYAVLGAAWGLRLEGSIGLLEWRALVPVVLAAVGSLLWTLPPKRRTAPARGGPRS